MGVEFNYHQASGTMRSPKSINLFSKRRVLTAKSINWKGHRKVVRLSNDSRLNLPLSACVTKDDEVVLGHGRVDVACSNGLANLLPTYFARELIRLGSLNLEFVVKEITETDEMDAYRALTEYHYRDQQLFGRTARLVVRSFHPSYPRIVGYIELATPFYMNKARMRVLNRPFKNGPIEWETWNREISRQYINTIVRIARCVIYPEFRGIGLGQVLVRHAKEFARSRWQVGGIKPCFIEISADMLKFVPFARGAGLHFIGETEGNLSRVATDIDYLLKNRNRVQNKEIVREEAFGIVDHQVSRMNKALAIMKRNGWEIGELVRQLENVDDDSSLKKLALLSEVLSFPKPTYFGGLDEITEDYIESGISGIDESNDLSLNIEFPEPISAPMCIENLSISHSSSVSRSKKTAAIQHAFGISPESIKHRIIDQLSFLIEPGQVTLIGGPSGSGKTSLLNALFNAGPNSKPTSIHVPKNFRPTQFKPIQSQRPLIDALGLGDVRTALALLGTVSLSDAFVYLKRFNELSAGQQYRAMMAKMICEKANVWFADEFCVNLDQITANSVALRLRSIAKEFGVALVVATPQPEIIASSLEPDLMIRLSTSWENEVVDGAEYLGRLEPKQNSFNPPTLKVNEEVIARIESLKETIALVPNKSIIHPGPVALKSRKISVPAMARSITKKHLKELTRSEALEAGYSSKSQLLVSQAERGVREVHQVTVVRLSPIT